MDLSTLKTEDTSVLENIKMPNGKTMEGVSITFYGKDSAKYHEIRRKIMDRRLAQADRRASNDLNTEEVDEAAMVYLTELTHSWKGVEWDGKPMSCTPGAARQVFDALPWLKEQAEAFIQNRANFFKVSSPA